MRRHLFFALWLVGLVAAQGAWAGTLPMENQPWVRVDGSGVVVLSNDRPDRASALAQDLEALRRAVGTVTTLDPTPPVPTWIYLFATDRSMIPYKHRYQGEPASISGAFYSRPYGDYILVNGAKRNEARLTVYHEYMHAVLRSNLPGLPLWLEEGLAELFSTFEKVDGGYRIGRPLRRHLHELSKGEPLPLVELLRIDVTSPRYHEFEQQGELYARSWELVHYLMLGNAERRGQMLALLRADLSGEARDKAFSVAFGDGFAALEKELAEYRKQGFAPRKVELEPVQADAFKLRSVAYGQILVHLGDLLVAQGDRERDAIFHFDEALRRRPDHGGAVAGLGLVAEEARDYAKARALFRKAVEAAPGDGRLHYHYGASLLVLGRGAAASKVEEARDHLRTCLKLQPSFAPAWARLRESLALGTDKPALPLPDDADEVLRLMLLHARSGERRAAHRLFDDFFKSRPEDTAKRSARHILTGVDWSAADGSASGFDLMRAGAVAPVAEAEAPR